MKTKLSKCKVLCVDDNAFFTDLLKILLQEIGIVNIREARTKEAGYKLYREFQPEISIVDVELSAGNTDGIELAQKIREEDDQTQILFLTSYYQENVYEKVRAVKPIAFMSKELSRLKLRQALELACDKISLSRGEDDEPAPQKSVPANDNHHPLKSGHFFFKIGDSYKPIEVSKIDFFYAANKLTYARNTGRNYPTSVQLKVLEKELSPTFIRCHKKYLVNVNRIEGILLREGKVKVANELLPIGYAYRKNFLNEINLLK